MKNIFLKTGILVLALAAGQFLFVRPALSANVTCFCSHNIENISKDKYTDARAVLTAVKSICAIKPDNQCNTDSVLTEDGKRFDQCIKTSGTIEECLTGEEERWKAAQTQKIKEVFGGALPTGGTGGTGTGGTVLGGIIPDCVLKGETTGKCGNVNIFLEVLLNLAHYLFGIIGALALAMFVYGGFVLIMSQGSPDKVKQGTGIMAAAVIGLVIAFGAYIIVQFLQTTIGFTEPKL